MKEIWTGRVGQAAAKYGEAAPTAAVCCNACRACVTTNAVGIALAAVTAAGAAAASIARRLTRAA
jgi:hypothetical protein